MKPLDYMHVVPAGQVGRTHYHASRAGQRPAAANAYRQGAGIYALGVFEQVVYQPLPVRAIVGCGYLPARKHIACAVADDQRALRTAYIKSPYRCFAHIRLLLRAIGLSSPPSAAWYPRRMPGSRLYRRMRNTCLPGVKSRSSLTVRRPTRSVRLSSTSPYMCALAACSLFGVRYSHAAAHG